MTVPKFKVATPEPGHNGDVGGIHFADGVAEVDEETHGAELAYFRGAGYAVEPVVEAEPDQEQPKRARQTTKKETDQ